MATFRSDQFSFHTDTKRFVAYISELEPAQGCKHGVKQTVPVFHRVYNDAADEGLIIVSSDTGVSVTYVMDSIDYYGSPYDSDIGGWRFVPTPESLRKVPNCKGTSVLVIND